MAASDNPWMRNIHGLLTYFRRAWGEVIGSSYNERGEDAVHNTQFEFPWTGFLQRLHGGRSEMPERCRLFLGCVSVLTVAFVVALAMDDASPTEKIEQGEHQQINNDVSGNGSRLDEDNVEDEFVGEYPKEFEESLPTIQEEKGEGCDECEAGGDEEGEPFEEAAEVFGPNCEDCRVVCSDCREAAKKTIRILTECGCHQGEQAQGDCRICGGSSVASAEVSFADHSNNGRQRVDLDRPSTSAADRGDRIETPRGDSNLNDLSHSGALTGGVTEGQDKEDHLTGKPLYWRERVLDILAPSLPPLPSVLDDWCQEERMGQPTTSAITTTNEACLNTEDGRSLADPEQNLTCGFHAETGQPTREQTSVGPDYSNTRIDFEEDLPPETSHDSGGGVWRAHESALPPTPNDDDDYEESASSSSGWDLEVCTREAETHPADRELQSGEMEEATTAEAGVRQQSSVGFRPDYSSSSSTSSSSCPADGQPRPPAPVPSYGIRINFDNGAARIHRSRPPSPVRPPPPGNRANVEGDHASAGNHDSSWHQVNAGTETSLPDYYRGTSRSPRYSVRISRHRNRGDDRGRAGTGSSWRIRRRGQDDHRDLPSTSSSSASASRRPGIDQPWVHGIGSAAHRERCQNLPRRPGDRRAKCGQIMVRTLREDPACVPEEGRTTRRPGHEDNFFSPRRGDVIVRHVICPGRGIIEVYFPGLEEDLQNGDSIVRMKMDAATYPTMIIVKAKAYIFVEGRWIYVGRHEHGVRKTDHRELD